MGCQDLKQTTQKVPYMASSGCQIGTFSSYKSLFPNSFSLVILSLANNAQALPVEARAEESFPVSCRRGYKSERRLQSLNSAANQGD